MENHEATQHEFARRCLRYFYDEADLDEREQLEDDLPVFAEGIYHFGGYDLDQRLAALTKQVEDLEELRDYLSEKLQEARQFQANQRKVNTILARQLKKAEAALGKPPTT